MSCPPITPHHFPHQNRRGGRRVERFGTTVHGDGNGFGAGVNERLGLFLNIHQNHNNIQFHSRCQLQLFYYYRVLNQCILLHKAISHKDLLTTVLFLPVS